jgi:hypothetical protein
MSNKLRPWAVALATASLLRQAKRADRTQIDADAMEVPEAKQKADLNKLAEAAKRLRAGKRSMTRAEARVFVKNMLFKYDINSVEMVYDELNKFFLAQQKEKLRMEMEKVDEDKI